jgi:hypothetical protein
MRAVMRLPQSLQREPNYQHDKQTQDPTGRPEHEAKILGGIHLCAYSLRLHPIRCSDQPGAKDLH